MNQKHSKDYCGFCGLDRQNVLVLIEGPCVCVCNECVELLAEMVEQKKKERIEKVEEFRAL